MSYAFLLKYIIIGDSGKSSLIQELASPASYCNILTNATGKSTKSPLASSLAQRCSSLRRITSNCKFGTQYNVEWYRLDNRASKPLREGTTAMQLAQLSSMTYPTETVLLILRSGWNRQRPMAHHHSCSSLWAIRATNKQSNLQVMQKEGHFRVGTAFRKRTEHRLFVDLCQVR